MSLSRTAFSKFSTRGLNISLYRNTRPFSAKTALKMPEQLKQSEVDKGQDPAVAKQWDGDTSTEKKFEDFAAMADGLPICMMGTARNGLGVCWHSVRVVVLHANIYN